MCAHRPNLFQVGDFGIPEIESAQNGGDELINLTAKMTSDIGRINNKFCHEIKNPLLNLIQIVKNIRKDNNIPKISSLNDIDNSMSMIEENHILDHVLKRKPNENIIKKN